MQAKGSGICTIVYGTYLHDLDRSTTNHVDQFLGLNSKSIG